MKKFLITAAIALGVLSANAGTMTFTTDLPVGTKVRILLNTTSATNPVTIDWGNGVEVKETVDPNQMAYNRWIDGSIEGSTIKISGNITEATLRELELTTALIENMTNLRELSLSDNKLRSFELSGYTPLKTLDLQNNNIVNSPSVNPTLSLEYAAETLQTLNIYNNPGLTCLNIANLENLETLAAYGCPDLASIFICLPEESRPNLKSLNLNDCALSHFYAVSLPNLEYLHLANNNLITSIYDTAPFYIGDYPSLKTLTLYGNRGIEELDITGLKMLESLSISDCNFKSLDVSQAPNLESLIAANNNISVFDLGNNPELKTINIAGNPVSELNIDGFEKISSVNISNTQISRINLMNAFYLTDFTAVNTNLEFIDFNGQQSKRMNKIDIRDNKKMTGETMTYTLRTVPEAKASGDAVNPNLLIAGSNGETAYTAIAEDIDHHWTLDVHGDGSARNTETTVTVDATDTGEKVTGHLDRLYPHFGMGLDYDLNLMETEGGKFLIVQWQPVWFQSIKSVTSSAYIGVPIHVYPYPEEGKKFKSVTVNGKDIASQWFVISGPSEIKVNFTSEENAISFTTTPGQNLSLLANTVKSNGTIWIDWGTGTRREYTGQNSYDPNYADIRGTRIDGSAAGSTITLYGEIAALDLSGWGDMADFMGLWDNAITSIDLSNADNLQYLNLYWNPLESIDLSGAPNLIVLDVSYTNLKTLDLSGATGLKWLDAYSDGWGDGEDGISMLKSIDVSCLPLLQHLEVKGNELTSLDVSKNPSLWYLSASGNKLTSIDLSKNPKIEELSLQNNAIASLDLSKQEVLSSLNVARNELTALDLSKNIQLSSLYIDNNKIKTIDLGKNVNLKTVYLNGNGMSADDLNDTYYMLPQRKQFSDEEESAGLSYNLAIIQGADREENDGTRADSSIAIDRGWKPSHQGSNGGSDYAYLDIRTPLHGTVAVKDGEGNEYVHGSKVPKYELLTIEATPEQGYTLASFMLNNEEPRTGNHFDMPGIYTKLTVTFAKGNGIDDLAGGIAVYADGGEIVVVADRATVDIFGVDGVAVVKGGSVSGSAAYSLPAGVYVVRAASAEGVVTRKLTVK